MRDRSLDITVIGAGIGGLTVAVALRRAGHTVTVYERTSTGREIGQGIAIAPNAGRILRDLGFDFARARTTRLTGIKFVKAETLEQLIPDRVDDDEGKFGIQSVSAYRPDLHAELLHLAGDRHGQGVPVKVAVHTPVTEINPEAGRVFFSDGTWTDADLVVSADGVHSTAASYLCHPEAAPPLRTDEWSVYRFTLPHKDMLANPDTEPLKPENDHRAYIAASVDGVRWLTWYFCRDKEMCSFALYTKNAVSHGLEALDENHSLRFRASRDALQNEMAGFHPSILKLAGMAVEVLPVWKCTSREPLQRFHRGRWVAIGDAAHPKLPSLAWGAVTAMEDGGFLGGLFTNIAEDENVNEAVAKRLKIFSEKRVPRTAAYKMYSDSTLFSDAPKEQNAKIAKWSDIKNLPASRAELPTWFKSYDAVKEAQQALRQAL